MNSLSSPPSSELVLKLCYYVNRTHQIQLVRIIGIPDWKFERVAFPGQRLLFEAPQTAKLEIQTSSNASAMIDTIACSSLQVVQSIDR